MKLILFPAFASPDTRHENAWLVRVSGVCLKTKTRRLQRKVLIKLLRRLTDVPDEELDSPLCQNRTAPFFMAPSRKRRIKFVVDEKPMAVMRKTKRNGQFRAKILIKDTELSDGVGDGGFINLSAHDEKSNVTAGSLQIKLIPAQGHSVISDIDDTIKFSNVEHRAELLANTFTREFRPIEGMPSVYQELQGAGYEFHYVTASPWQLYRPLREFLTNDRYPDGSMHFRTFRLSDHLLKRLGVIHRGGKAAAVRRILASFPNRQFTLIGDSGEKDVEIYSRCYQQFPDRIKRIVIRLIRPEHQYRESVIEAGLMLPTTVFHTFESPGQLRKIMDLKG